MTTDFIFADDARQTRPSRKDLGKLLALGGIHVPGENVGPLETNLEELCRSVGFPRDQQFKWSPGKKESFQKQLLGGEERLSFFGQVVDLAKKHDAVATVVAEDEQYRCARKESRDHSHDVTTLFLERAAHSFKAVRRRGVVVIAKPGTGGSEKKFLASCMDLLESGTNYVDLNRLALPVMTMPSRHVRILQLADVVASCTVARISGESNFSPRIFECLKPLFRSESGRIGGVGLKLHPDYKYANLYHWLLGDSHFVKGGSGHPLPMKDRPYSNNSGEATSDR